MKVEEIQFTHDVVRVTLVFSLDEFGRLSLTNPLYYLEDGLANLLIGAGQMAQKDLEKKRLGEKK